MRDLRREADNLRAGARLQKALALSIACTIAFSGCGKKQETAPETPEPRTELPAPTTTTLSAPTTTTQPSSDDFDAALREVLQLETSGQFSQALMRCRKSRSRFRSHPRVSELEEAQVRLQESKREGIRLRIAVQNLGSDEALTAQAARTAGLHGLRARPNCEDTRCVAIHHHIAKPHQRGMRLGISE